MNSEMNLYPNRGEAFVLPIAEKEQSDTDKEIKSDVETYQTLYQDLIEALELDIEALGSIDKLDDVKDATEHMNNVQANKIARNILRVRKEALQSVIDTHTKSA